MLQHTTTYQSILLNLSLIPAGYLQEVELYLENRLKQIQRQEQNREKIMALAGAWSEMEEGDFQEMMAEAKRSGGEMFNREATL